MTTPYMFSLLPSSSESNEQYMYVILQKVNISCIIPSFKSLNECYDMVRKWLLHSDDLFMQHATLANENKREYGSIKRAVNARDSSAARARVERNVALLLPYRGQVVVTMIRFRSNANKCKCMRMPINALNAHSSDRLSIAESSSIFPYIGHSISIGCLSNAPSRH